MNQKEKGTIEKAVFSTFGFLPQHAIKSRKDHLKFILGTRRKTTLEYAYKEINGNLYLMATLTLRLPNYPVRSAEDYVDSWDMTVEGQKTLIHVLLQEIM
jgi:hypothetical protein